MLWIIIGIVIVAISLEAPLWLSILLLGVNLFIPDPIPFIDEIVQFMGIANKIKNLQRAGTFYDWVCAYKLESLILPVVLVGSVLYLFIT